MWLYAGAQLHAPMLQVSGKSPVALQHRPVLTVPPVWVHSAERPEEPLEPLEALPLEPLPLLGELVPLEVLLPVELVPLEVLLLVELVPLEVLLELELLAPVVPAVEELEELAALLPLDEAEDALLLDDALPPEDDEPHPASTNTAIDARILSFMQRA